MIEVRHLVKDFGPLRAVDDVSFPVGPGETFALLGPNGSGKTTILKCLAGLVHPTSGEVRIDGPFSYLPQRVAFPENLTAREVLRFYARLRRAPLDRAQFNGFPDRPVQELSGGMLQRLGIAVAALGDAPVLLLDEPTISLDPEGAGAFREFLTRLRGQGRTILFSTHVLPDVEVLADRVGVLAGGRLAALKPMAELRRPWALEELYRELVYENRIPTCSDAAGSV
jgi:Cu-processing system ATP-binding protein